MTDDVRNGGRRGNGAPGEDRERETARSDGARDEGRGQPQDASGDEPPAKRTGGRQEHARRAAPVAELLSNDVIDGLVQRREREWRAEQAPALPPLDSSDVSRLLAGDHSEPHRILGAHPATLGGKAGIVIRAYHPDAARVQALIAESGAVEMQQTVGGLFQAFLPGAAFPVRYRLRFHFSDGSEWERGDPYMFLPSLGEVDLHLFNEGTHRRLWEKLGAHTREMEGVQGVAFAVWAPNARRVSVIGDFCGWDGRLFPMRQLGSSGVFEIFIPDIGEHTLYKYELLTREGVPRIKTDPFAFKLEQAPSNASIVIESRYIWSDEEWMHRRAQTDWSREPMSIYEVHLGSWARVPEEGNRPLSYTEIAPRLAEYAKKMGYTHVEFLPLAEHPFTGSWGYQVAGYYAPTSRYGSPDDLRFLIDTLHQHGIGVLMDWVPAHFPKDDWALRRFDGTALFEHEDPRLGEHPDWGTLIFNYGRPEVRNFLIANALYWLDEFHVDGLRVDAVASMLYLDYSRPAGQWLRNRYGGRENLEAIEFLKQMTETVRVECPGTVTVAEESTAWPGVTKPPQEGGLGFTFKWNMGWMHDTLSYFEKDPIHRRHHHDMITFAMLYEYTERFIMPLSHDEVVHLKKSLLDKMPGDVWQKFANMRALFLYQYTRPGKLLDFMGTELGTWREWNHDQSLEWHLQHQPMHGGLHYFVQELGALYRGHSPLWRLDHDPAGFQWIDANDRDNSVYSYFRRDGDRHVVVVLNMTPVPRDDYRIGAPAPGAYVQLLTSDDPRFGGSGYRTQQRVKVDPSPYHGFQQSMRLTLPPLGGIVLVPEEAVPEE